MVNPTRRQSSRNSNGDETATSKRKLSSSSKKTEKSVAKDKDQWVCMLNDELINTGTSAEERRTAVCSLKHPRTGCGDLFLMPADNSAVFQLFNFKEKYRSWFIGENVHSDGGLYITTPMDPLFLILPYLMNTNEAKRFMSLDQLLCDADFPDCAQLVNVCHPAQVSLVCDCKDVDDDLQVFRYNKDKTLEWLKKKTETLAESLEAENIQVSAKSSHSSIFVRSKSATISKASYIEYALGMISDYLCLGLEEELKNHLGITKEKESVQENQTENEPPSKKSKLSGDTGPTDDYSLGVDLKNKKKDTKLTVAQKKLSKVDKTGMKSISSFFSPKS